MSVLKNHRSLSEYEYEHSFNEMMQYFRIQFQKVPNRRKRFVCYPITDILRDTQKAIMELSTGFVQKPQRDKWRYGLLLRSVQNLISLQQPLYNYWNAMSVDQHHQERMCFYINREIALLHGMLMSNPIHANDTGKEVQHILYYTPDEIFKATFLSNMHRLHRYTHSKAIHIRKEFDGFETSMIIELVNDAWYHCIQANKILPETNRQYLTRRAHITKAISSLKGMNRPMLSLFILMGYSENTMREWSGMLSKELKLLYALQKSDKKRFSSLE